MGTYINLEPEIKCGFQISAKRKKLWNSELELLEQFEAVCRNHNLKYFLIGGSAIGVERHQGFIPWDDDLDIGMLRPDFEAFIRFAREELHEPYHLQYGVDNLEDASYFCRIRLSNTTGVTRWELNRKCNNGIFIEVYPFDKVPKSKILAYAQIELSSLFRQLIEARYTVDNRKGLFGTFKILFKPFTTKQLFCVWDKICCFYNHFPCKMVNTVSLSNYAKQGVCKYLYSDVLTTEYKKFENTFVQVSTQNDSLLRKCYGDYMQLPPEDKRGTHHNDVVYFDPDCSYKEVLKSDLPSRYFQGEYHLGEL